MNNENSKHFFTNIEKLKKLVSGAKLLLLTRLDIKLMYVVTAGRSDRWRLSVLGN